MLIEEEMRRVIAFGHWKVVWWRKRFDCRLGVGEDLSEGLRAYAAEHAHLELVFVEKLVTKWDDVRERARLVLANLASGVFPNSPPIEINVEVDLDGDEV
jgi:hypothetical protein